MKITIEAEDTLLRSRDPPSYCDMRKISAQNYKG